VSDNISDRWAYTSRLTHETRSEGYDIQGSQRIVRAVTLALDLFPGLYSSWNRQREVLSLADNPKALSHRIRPGVEVPSWVYDEIRSLEAKLAEKAQL